MVRVASRPQLQDFMRVWRFHHPLTEDQLAYADAQARVVDVGFYHGGHEAVSPGGCSGDMARVLS